MHGSNCKINVVVTHNLSIHLQYAIVIDLMLHVYIVPYGQKGWQEDIGGLLKLCHLAEFTLALEPVLAMIFTTKWLIKGAGNLIEP